MRRWGLDVPAICVLCSANNETRQHLFFECPFSTSIWDFFMNRANLHPPPAFDATLRWLDKPSPNRHVVLIIRLIYQASMYSIWKERNARIHSAIPRSPGAIIAEVKDILRLRLDPLSRSSSLIALTPSSPPVSILGTWLSLF